jgi:hypothetical protein
MTWEALAAIGSIGSAVVLLVGAIAAIVQIRHFRLASQLDCYLQMMQELMTPENMEARAYVRVTDFSDPEVLEKALSPRMDSKVSRVMNYLQSISRLLVLGIVDEGMMAIHRHGG